MIMSAYNSINYYQNSGQLQVLGLACEQKQLLCLDPMAKEAQLSAAEGALLGLDVELLLPQDGEDVADVAEMLL